MEQDDNDIELEEMQALKQFSQGRAGEDLAAQLGLAQPEAPIAEEQAPLEGVPGEEPAPADELRSIPPELLAQVIAALKAEG